MNENELCLLKQKYIETVASTPEFSGVKITEITVYDCIKPDFTFAPNVLYIFDGSATAAKMFEAKGTIIDFYPHIYGYRFIQRTNAVCGGLNVMNPNHTIDFYKKHPKFHINTFSFVFNERKISPIGLDLII